MTIGKVYIMFFCILSFSYAEELLPKSVLLEKSLISAQRYEQHGKFDKARKEFEKIEKMQEKLPNEFYYLYAKNLYLVQNYHKAQKYFAVYLRRAKRGDKFYRDALEYLGKIDEKNADEKDRYEGCDGLGEKIYDAYEACQSECEEAVDEQIVSRMHQYPLTNTQEMYDKWYPQCMEICEGKSYNKLKRKYRKNNCKDYE